MRTLMLALLAAFAISPLSAIRAQSPWLKSLSSDGTGYLENMNGYDAIDVAQYGVAVVYVDGGTVHRNALKNADFPNQADAFLKNNPDWVPVPANNGRTRYIRLTSVSHVEVVGGSKKHVTVYCRGVAIASTGDTNAMQRLRELSK